MQNNLPEGCNLVRLTARGDERCSDLALGRIGPLPAIRSSGSLARAANDGSFCRVCVGRLNHPDYSERLQEMEEWYRALLGRNPATAEAGLLDDFQPHEHYLRKLEGRILDLGGGAGLAARFLNSNVEYVVVDPSELWQAPEWRAFAEGFIAGGPRPTRVTAFGEKLPFPNGHFDGAIAFWSLNHVRDPAACLAELARTVRAGGAIRLVLEDMEPTWGDLVREGSRRVCSRLARVRPRGELPLRGAIRLKLSSEWPLQGDHIRVQEPQLRQWTSSKLVPENRTWLGGFLTLDFRRATKFSSAI